MTDLGTIVSTGFANPGSEGYAVNASGQVVGSGTSPSTNEHAFVYSNGKMTDLGTFGGYTSVALGINSSGWVVGWSDNTFNGGNGRQAFLYCNGTMTDLGTSGNFSQANGINDSGQIVGGPVREGHAWLWQSGNGMQDLGTLPGSTNSSAIGINNGGQVVGTCDNGHSFLWQSGSGMRDLGTLPGGTYCYAAAINNRGQVVGQANTASGNSDPILWQSGSGMQDLKNQIAPSSGLTLSTVTAINDNGLIVGYGTNSGGQTQAVLLTPNATIALANAVNTTIIKGGSGMLGTTVSNTAGSGANNLNYTLAATVQSGNTTLGSSSGSVAPGSSQPATLSATSTNLGVNTMSLTASDPNSTNLPQSTTAKLTVLDHSNASLSSTPTKQRNDQLWQRAERGDHPQPELHHLQSGRKHLGSLHGEHEAHGFLDKRQYGFQHKPLDLQWIERRQRQHLHGLAQHEQLTRQEAEPSACPPPSWRMTATARSREQQQRRHDNHAGSQRGQCHRRQEQFANFLRHRIDRTCRSERQLRQPGIKATATTGSGGYDMVGSTATILAGTNSSGSSQTVSMAWRTQTQAERKGPGLISDVVD